MKVLVEVERMAADRDAEQHLLRAILITARYLKLKTVQTRMLSITQDGGWDVEKCIERRVCFFLRRMR